MQQGITSQYLAALSITKPRLNTGLYFQIAKMTPLILVSNHLMRLLTMELIGYQPLHQKLMLRNHLINQNTLPAHTFFKQKTGQEM